MITINAYKKSNGNFLVAGERKIVGEYTKKLFEKIGVTGDEDSGFTFTPNQVLAWGDLIYVRPGGPSDVGLVAHVTELRYSEEYPKERGRWTWRPLLEVVPLEVV